MRRVALAYGVGLACILHVVILAFLVYNLTEYGPVKELKAAPLVARNTGAQRNIRGEQARQLSSISHGSSVEPRTLSPTLGQIGNTPRQTTNKAAVASKLSSSSSPADREEVGVASKMGVVSERIETESGPASRKDVNGSISSERWRRLKPPSMLLADKDERAKMELYVEAERRESWRREQRRISALADLEERGVRELPVNKDKVAQGRIGGKPEKTRRPAGGKVVGRGGQRGGQSKDNPMKEFIADALAEEHKRAEELNEKWKKRRDMLESGKKLLEEGGGGGSPKLSVKEYFHQVCEEPAGPLVECSETPPRKLSSFEASGNDIMLSIRTTLKYHDTRLPVLFDTWLGEVEPSNVFVVTDGEDEDLLWKTNTLGMHYVNIESGQSHNQSDLCCKAGVELELMMAPENHKYNWICHIDDDMYVNLKPLVSSLSHFDPRTDKVYYGRSGTPLEEPRQVKNVSTIGVFGRRYFFAVGGMYCLSRAMLELAKPYLVGCKAFASTCSKAQEPEDVTVGLVVGVMLNQKLQWTEMIYSHGLDLLSSTPTPYLHDQVAFSYGFGASGGWNIIPNVVYVPGALYNIDEDITQFKSLHCHFHSQVQWCLDKKRQVLEERNRLAAAEVENAWTCECSWKKVICCQVYKDNYATWMQKRVLELKEQERKGKELHAAELEKGQLASEELRKKGQREKEAREHEGRVQHRKVLQHQELHVEVQLQHKLKSPVR